MRRSWLKSMSGSIRCSSRHTRNSAIRKGISTTSLLVVLDNLLAAPAPKEPVKLVQPKVFYSFADPDLEARSASQKILMRMGSRNEAIIKARLREIKQQVMLHMHDKRGIVLDDFVGYIWLPIAFESLLVKFPAACGEWFNQAQN